MRTADCATFAMLLEIEAAAAAQASGSARTTASAELNWRNGFSLAGTFEGKFSDVTRRDAGKGAGRYQW
jgi:hypothetical protein